MTPASPVCPSCGRPAELPSITPELLFFRAGRQGAALPWAAAFLAPDRRAIAFEGTIYAITEDDWCRFEQMRRDWQAQPLDHAA